VLCEFFLFLGSKVCVLTIIVDRLQPVNSQSRWFNFSRSFHHLERYFLPAFTYHDRKFGRRRDLRHARWLTLINSSRSELTRERRNSLFLVEMNSAEEDERECAGSRPAAISSIDYIASMRLDTSGILWRVCGALMSDLDRTRPTMRKLPHLRDHNITVFAHSVTLKVSVLWALNLYAEESRANLATVQVDLLRVYILDVD